MSSGHRTTGAPCGGSIEELRTCWHVPSIAHFIYLFKDGLKLPFKIDYQDLELAFLTPIPEPGTSRDQDEHVLLKLMITLLKGYFNEYRIDESSWESYLKKLYRLQWVSREGNTFPFLSQSYDSKGKKTDQEIAFSDLSLQAKAEIVYHLCEYRLYAEDSSDLVAHLVDDELRVQPLGRDGRGNIYWYFFGTRLYRECPAAGEQVKAQLESIARYREKQALDLAMKANDELEKKREQEKNRKRMKSDPIPGERSSSRKSKPVDRLNGNTLRASSKNSKTSDHQNSKNCPDNNKKQETTPDPSTSCGVPLTDLQSAWDCICDSESEWESFASSLSKSKVPCEAELCSILNTNFLPLIQEVAAKARKEREKEHKAKILELLPRRTSSRIETKKIQQEEDEKREAEQREEQKRRAAQAEERRKREEERMRHEDVRRQREERARQRLALIEDRADRTATQVKVANGAIHDLVTIDEDDDDIGVGDPDVTMILSNGWPPNEHSYSSPKGYVLLKAGYVNVSPARF